MIINISQWALLAGAVMPVVVGIITKEVASPSIKATTLLVLDALSGVLFQWLATPEGFNVQNAVVTALATLITSVGTYYGWVKHTVAPVVNIATARFGLGPSSSSSIHIAA